MSQGAKMEVHAGTPQAETQDEAVAAWRAAYERTPEREVDFETLSGEPIRPLYTEHDLPDSRRIGVPGEYPFTRGVYPSMYRGRLWTMRQFAGFGTAEETNERFHYLLDHGQTGLSTAFDMPSLMGLDSDHSRSLGEVGREVNANSLAFMQHVPMALLAWAWAAPNLGEIATVPTSTWMAVAFLALVATAGVAVLQVHAQRVVPAQLAALVFGLEPVFAAVFAYALLGEVLGWRGAVGGVLLVAAIAYSQVAHARAQPHAPDQVPPSPDGELRPPTPGTTWRQELSGEAFDD